MAYILVNTAKYNGEKLEIIDEAQAQIDDFESISDARKECVLMAYSNCLLMGDTQYKFNPKNNMTRAEFNKYMNKKFDDMIAKLCPKPSEKEVKDSKK